MKELFIKFLEENNVRDIFFVRYTPNFWHNMPIEIYFDVADPSSYISRAFDWSQSSEGHDFWEELSDEWQIFLKNPNEYNELKLINSI